MRILRSAVATLVVLAAGCSSTRDVPSDPPGTCDNFTGSYVLDRSMCESSRKLLPVPVEVGRYPDGTIIGPERVMVGINQGGCATIGFSTRGIENDASWLRRSLFMKIGDDADAPRWKEGALPSSRRKMSNLPAPIAIGASGDWYWRLRRDAAGVVRYEAGYAERGLFFLIPYAGQRELSCPLTRTQRRRLRLETEVIYSS